LIFIVGCKNNVNKIQINQDYQTREDKLKTMFLNKKINSIENTLSQYSGYSVSSKDKIIFLYTGNDCQSCIDKGYEVIKNCILCL
jgi:hypothetical protein